MITLGKRMQMGGLLKYTHLPLVLTLKADCLRGAASDSKMVQDSRLEAAFPLSLSAPFNITPSQYEHN